jgi:integrase/recombinase XerC
VTGLTVLEGGGEPRPLPPPCQVCVCVHHGDCAVLGRHLKQMKLLGRTERTIRERRNAVLRMGRWLSSESALPFRTPVSVLDATAADLTAWRSGLDLCPGAIGSYVAHAREFYRFLTDEGIRQDNPARDLPVPRMPRRLPRPIGESELFFALEAAPPRIRPWIVLTAWCALRSKEVAFLLRSSILDQASPPVLVVTAAASKGGRHERAIPLSGFVLAELRTWNLPASGYAFPRRDGHSGPNQPWLVSHLIGEHFRSLGIAATAHQLRHRALSQAYIHSLDLRAVQEIAGHSSPAITAGYCAYAPQAAIDALEGIPSPPRLHVIRKDDTA